MAGKRKVEEIPEGKVALVVTVKGKTYTLALQSFSALDELMIWQHTGQKLTLCYATQEFDLFTVAGLIWRHRVRAGETQLTYVEVAEELDFGDSSTLRFEGLDDAKDGEAGAPEA